MPFFLAGVAVLVLIIVGARFFARANPRLLAAVLRALGGVVALAVAGLLLIRGVIGLAIPLALFGLTLIKGQGFNFANPFAGARRSPGQRSKVHTEGLDMELDHDTGNMEGLCHTGRFAGRTLSSLSETELLELLEEFHASPQEGALLEAYLDWRVPNWRDERQEDAQEARTRRRAGSGKMDVAEAYAVLGLRPGASEAEIRRAHRKLMKKVHPDQGGSNALAAKINEAREVLLDQARAKWKVA